MKAIKVLMLVVLVGGGRFASFSQNIDFQFEHISVDDGLPGLVTLRFAQDKRGFMYMSSWDAGLIRFDGYEYKRYWHNPKNPASIPNGIIVDLATDSTDNLWINSAGSLFRLDPKTEKFQKFELPGSVSHISSDENHLYVGGEFGLLRYSASNQFDTLWSHHLHRLGNEKNVVCILPLSSGEVWFITLDVIARLNTTTGKVRYAPFARQLNEGFSATMAADRFGHIWIGTYLDGLFRFDTTRFEFVSHNYEQSSNRPSKNFINHTFVDQHGRFYIATNGNGLTVFDKSYLSFRNYLPENVHGSINGRITGKIFQDNQQNIWIGTYGDGINKINLGKQAFRYYESYKGKGDGLPGRLIAGMAEGKDGTTWMGLDDDGGLVRFDPKTGVFKVYRQKNGLINDKVSGVWEDQAGNIWVASSSTGLSRYSVSGSELKLEKSFENVWACSFLAFHSKSGLWAGGSAVDGNKLYKYSEESDLFLPTEISLTAANPTFDDAGNVISFSTRDRGLMYIDHETLQVRTLKVTQSADEAYASAVRYVDGKLWIANTEELQCLDLANGKTEHFGLEKGFPQNTDLAVSIINDNSGNIWFTTNRGIYRFDSKTESIAKIRSDSRFDIHANGLLKSSDGLFYIADHNGFVVFHPDSVRLDQRPVKTAITTFSLANEHVPIYNANDSSTFQSPLFVSITDTEYLELTHNQNDFAFRFTAFEYSRPDEVKFRYKLEHFNDDWIYTDPGDRTANYTNLSHGSYNFIVQATLSDQWGDEPSQLTIRILPPWWHTWWAYTIYGICFCLGVFGVHTYQKAAVVRKERERTKDRELEQARKVEKAFQELGVAHDNLKSTQAQLIQSEKMASLGELTAGIAHEIQNPLNFVNNFSELSAELVEEIKVERSKGQEARDETLIDSNLEDVRENLEKVRQHGRRADAIVKGMLEHSRKHSGEKVETDINALAEEYLKLGYHGMRAKDKSFTCDYQTDLDPNLPKIKVIPQDIGRVLLNIINNAFQAVNEKVKASNSDFIPNIKVSTRQLPPQGGKGGYVKISVSDNGPGIPDSIKDKIFQPFFTTKPTGEGTGLGLSLAYDIVKAHGGELKIESEIGEGTEFLVQIPF